MLVFLLRVFILCLSYSQSATYIDSILGYTKPLPDVLNSQNLMPRYEHFKEISLRPLETGLSKINLFDYDEAQTLECLKLFEAAAANLEMYLEAAVRMRNDPVDLAGGSEENFMEILSQIHHFYGFFVSKVNRVLDGDDGDAGDKLSKEREIVRRITTILKPILDKYPIKPRLSNDQDTPQMEDHSFCSYSRDKSGLSDSLSDFEFVSEEEDVSENPWA